ncbi:MAG: hypothetical protein Q9191_008117, partial [Dirinaria sp. TL-2023a]
VPRKYRKKVDAVLDLAQKVRRGEIGTNHRMLRQKSQKVLRAITKWRRDNETPSTVVGCLVEINASLERLAEIGQGILDTMKFANHIPPFDNDLLVTDESFSSGSGPSTPDSASHSGETA